MRLHGQFKEWRVRTRCALPIEPETMKEIAWNIECILKRLSGVYADDEDIVISDCTVAMECETDTPEYRKYFIELLIDFSNGYLSAHIHRKE